ncbi:MAG: hypothetical protein A2068_12280 [Ignavibacteria bacterium GWB2_35_6b]|nr:MAG: hypothetical protein A2068_12280 [Ignavibacteria bacterium GWB2_35_6b]
MNKSEENKVKQSNITAGGSVAGRDNNTYNNISQNRNLYMCELIKKFKSEQEQNKTVTEIIDELRHYKTNIDNGSKVIGLEQKLINGSREDLIDFAIITKERFAKKLIKYEYFESAQGIFSYLLAIIYSNFNIYISPLLKENKTAIEINKKIDEHVINPLLIELDENVLKIHKDEINGMLFFLTGNCHIKWQ